jgi:hypothetical protein
MRHLQDAGGTLRSRLDELPGKDRAIFAHIETGLREFQSMPYRRLDR